MVVRVQRLNPDQAIELRAFLQRSSNVLTETWTTLIQPD
jgi:glucan biosynthesis protein